MLCLFLTALMASAMTGEGPNPLDNATERGHYAALSSQGSSKAAPERTPEAIPEPAPKPALSGIQIEGPIEPNKKLKASLPSWSGASYTWFTRGNGQISSAKNLHYVKFVFTKLPFSIHCLVSDACGAIQYDCVFYNVQIKPSQASVAAGKMLDLSATVSIPRRLGWKVLESQGGTLQNINKAKNTATYKAPKTPGAYTVRVFDICNSSAYDDARIKVEPPLTLSIVAPQEGLLTNEKQITVTGHVSNPKATVTVNGVPATLNATSGAYSCLLSPPEGPYTITASATDVLNTIPVTATRQITLDRTPPIVTLHTPPDGLVTKETAIKISGKLDDPQAKLFVSGSALAFKVDGAFESIQNFKEGSQLIVALATDPAGNSGYATKAIHVDLTPPVITFLDPTPAENDLCPTSKVPVVFQVSEAGEVKLNNELLTLEAQSDGRLLAKKEITAPEGILSLTVKAKDKAGNESAATRKIQVGLSQPVIRITVPALDAKGSFTTKEGQMKVQGRVEASDFSHPLILKRGQEMLPLGQDNSFSFDWPLKEGSNLENLEAVTRFGHKGNQRVYGLRYTESVKVKIESPLNGHITTAAQIEIKGSLSRSGCQVTLQNGAHSVAATVKDTLFSATLPISVGDNTVQAIAMDPVGNTGQDQIQVSRVVAEEIHAKWDEPQQGASVQTRTVSITGQADIPGIASVTVNGVPMSLTGMGIGGRIQGSLPLEKEGLNVLIMERRTVAGKTTIERRDVYYRPKLPVIMLKHPENARTGARLPIQVIPASDTQLQSADISFNGQWLGRFSAPFATTAQIPADATPGQRFSVEAVGMDGDGQQVKARGSVSVYGGGALLVKVFDDRTGLPFRKDAPISGGVLPKVRVAIEGGESIVGLDDKGQAALATALPEHWVTITASDWTPVWRAASLQTASPGSFMTEAGKVEAPVETLPGARLTPMKAAKTSDPGDEGIQIHTESPGVPAISTTPLSAQGLPALLPLGWTPVRAWWIEASPANSMSMASADITLPAGSQMDNVTFVWAMWDSQAKQWTALSVDLGPDTLSKLPLPSSGGYALLLADPAPLAPPMPLKGEKLPGLQGDAWREVPVSLENPLQIMSTVDAIKGARMEPRLVADFGEGQPIASGALLQAEVGESYTLMEKKEIQLEKYTQDLILHRHSLIVSPDGAHQLQSQSKGLLLRNAMRMSRLFQETELVEGLMAVDYFHRGVQVITGGTETLGQGGGKLSQSGVTLNFQAGALTRPTLVILQPEADPAAAWPELAKVVKAFHVSFHPKAKKAISIALTDLQLEANARPLLLTRRVVNGESLVLAVGELLSEGKSWTLKAMNPPLLEGGPFAVVVPDKAWDWLMGNVSLPPALRESLPSENTILDAAFYKSVSGPDGAFAVPALTGEPRILKGERPDLGLSGAVTASAPAKDLVLRLDPLPFLLQSVSPNENEVVSLQEIITLSASTPIAGDGFQDIKLYQISPGAEALRKAKASQEAEIPCAAQLSQDQKTLTLVPQEPLKSGANYKLVIRNLKGATGTVLPESLRHFKAQSQAASIGVDFLRMKLSYPDSQCRVTVTVPEGAAPPWALVEITAPQFGSSCSSIMPPTGSLSAPLKASLGEVLQVRVQRRDGSQVQGQLSRYESPEGKVTLSVDGGRVEGPEGLAVVIPKGMLAKPAEFQVQTLTDPAVLTEGVLQPGEKATPALKLHIKGDVTFTEMPIIEFPASQLDAQADTQPKPGAYFGNGPLGVMVKRSQLQPDGKSEDFFQFVDTASLVEDNGGKKIVSHGGLRIPEKTRFSGIAPGDLARTGPTETPITPLCLNGDCANRKVVGVNIPTPALGTGFGNWALSLYVLQFPALQTGYRYNAGRVYRNFNVGEGCDTPSENAYAPLPGAEVYRGKRKNAGVSGRILALSDDCGYYVINGIPVYDPSGNPVPTEGSPEIPVNTYNAVDPRTGSCSETEFISPANHVNKNTDYWIWIKTKVNIFDPNLKAPRLRVDLRDSTGKARTIWRKGEIAKLHIDQGTDSVPVTKLSLKGGVEQSLSNPVFPLDLPITFTTEGAWQVSIEGWSAAIVSTGTLNCEVLVTPYTDLGPSKPGVKPYLVAYSPEPDEKRDPMDKVSPSDKVVLTFSEPVKIVGKSAFLMEKQDPATGQWEKLDCQVLADGVEVNEDKLFAQAWMVPSQRWPLGVKVRIRVADASSIVDQDKEFMLPFIWSFTVRGAEEIGATASGALLDMVAHKGNLYAVEKLGESLLDPGWDAPGYPVCGIRVFGVSSPDQPKSGVLFGGHGCIYPTLDPVYSGFEVKRPDMVLKDGLGHEIAVEPFYLHRIIQMRKAEGVSLNGKARDLLLVATAPRVPCQGSAILAPTNTTGASQYLTNSTLWAFDITGDADSLDVNLAPKMLMSTSIGKTTTSVSLFGLPAGLGSAGGALGVIWRNAGMKILDGKAWRDDFKNDATAAGGEPQLARLSRKYQGYYPPNATIATNDISHAHGVAPVWPMVLHSVISGDDEGKPVGFASLGLTGKLVHIDPKVGTGEALVAYNPAPGMDLDSRVTDLSASVDNERVLRVETLRGSWQSNTGNDQGLLLLIATDKNFWVFKCTWENKAFALKALAKAKLQDLSQEQNTPWNQADIQTDQEKMLVGVKTGNKASVFDLKKLVSQDGALLILKPICEFTPTGAWTLKDGLLYDNRLQDQSKTLVIKNIDGLVLKGWDGVPYVISPKNVFKGLDDDYDSDRIEIATASNLIKSLTQQKNGDREDPGAKLYFSMISRRYHPASKDTTSGQDNSGLVHFYPDLGPRDITLSLLADSEAAATDIGSPNNGNKKWYIQHHIESTGDTFPLSAVSIVPMKPDVGLQQVKFTELSTQTFHNFYSFRVMNNVEFLDNSNDKFGTKLSRWLASPYRVTVNTSALPVETLHAMMTDPNKRYSFAINFKFYQNQEFESKEKPEAQFRFNFIVKFNASTTLLDVMTGGVWYQDPTVSGPSHKNTALNPAARAIEKVLLQAPMGDQDTPVPLSQIPQGARFAPANVGDPETTDDILRVLSVQPSQFTLGNAQNLLNQMLNLTRRRVVKNTGAPSHKTKLQAVVNGIRATIFDDQGQNPGDLQGIFGHRTAMAVNALQSVDNYFAPNGKERILKNPDTWLADPSTLPVPDKKMEFDSDGNPVNLKIAPIIKSRLTKRSKDARGLWRTVINPDSALLQYYVAYPKLRETADPGTYAINRLITRDLMLGGFGSCYGLEDVEGVDTKLDLPVIQEENSRRQLVDQALGDLMACYASKGAMSDLDAKAIQALRLSKEQRVLVDIDGTHLYNPGVGMLHFLIKEDWSAGQAPSTAPPVNTNPDKDVLFLIDKVEVSGQEPGVLHGNIHQQVEKFLYERLPSLPERFDVMINGSLNLLEHAYADGTAIAQTLRKRLGREGAALVVVPYNDTRRDYDGNMGLFEVFDDLWDKRDIIRGFADNAKERLTKNPDTLRAIATLRSVVKLLWDEQLEKTWVSLKLPHWQTRMQQAAQQYQQAKAESDPAKQAAKLKEVAQTVQTLNRDIRLALKGLFRMRSHLTLHGHSQGASKCAAAMTRLGSLIVTRMPFDWIKEDGALASAAQEVMPVAPKFRLQTYGAGTCATDWCYRDYDATYGTGIDSEENPWGNPEYRKMIHHVNQMDTVGLNVGMLDPWNEKSRSWSVNYPKSFKNTYNGIISLPEWDPVQNKMIWKRSSYKDKVSSTLRFQSYWGVTAQPFTILAGKALGAGGYIPQILKCPKPLEITSFLQNHVVIVHPSVMGYAIHNVGEHNFVKAYAENVDDLPPTPFDKGVDSDCMKDTKVHPYNHKDDWGKYWWKEVTGEGYPPDKAFTVNKSKPPLGFETGFERPVYKIIYRHSFNNYYWGSSCPKDKDSYSFNIDKNSAPKYKIPQKLD